MKPASGHDDLTCKSVRDIFPALSPKWAMLIVELLVEHPRRFSDLKRALGTVTQKSLTAALRDLERDGVIARIVTPTIPPRVDYELTGLGHSLLEPALEMARWALAHRHEIEEARERFATRA
ncbi:MAG TPA: helix-turn-helix domain-containing protein [Devosia sp.]|jgi:DNA-binding HxlR family transcriptional regulator|nr:helix-turn-helix domain-containing protein [Devosia sp.]